MSFIDHIIPTSKLELIRDRIYSVLSSEFDNQVYVLNNLNCYGVTFWAERFVPLDKTELAAIVIKTFKGDYDNQSVGSQHGTYIYSLEVAANSATIGTTAGSKLASFRLQKLLMAIRYILMSPVHLTLGLTGVVEHTEVSNWQIYEDDRSDSSNTALGQLLFSVKCEEPSAPNSGTVLAVSETDVYIELTNQGYQYLKHGYE